MKLKKAISLCAAISMSLGAVACGSDSGSGSKTTTAAGGASTTAAAGSETTAAGSTAAASSGDKTVINLYAFTDEVPKMVEEFCKRHPDFAAKYEVKTTIKPTTNQEYQPVLDAALAADGVDMFCAEAAFVKKYTQGDGAKYTAAYEDLGISDVAKKISDAEIAQYTVDIGTNKDGKVVGLGYQATGGAFIYRRSIAKDVFGTDDPGQIKTQVGPGWDKFWEAAAKLKEKNYGIVSGDGDVWHAVENSSSSGWVNDDGKLVIDPKREEFFDISKKLKDNGWHNDTRDWTDGWYADMRDQSGKNEKGEADVKNADTKKIFGYFGPAWLINYTIVKQVGGEKKGEGTYGDWAVTEPPVGFFWGGTWVLGAKNSKNKEAVGQIIEWITLDTSKDGLQYGWANGTIYGNGGTKDSVASSKVMKESDGKLDMLDGQNMFDVFVPANASANGKTLTQYDEDINAIWRDQVRMYTSGQKSKEEAIKAFKQKVKDDLDIDSAG